MAISLFRFPFPYCFILVIIFSSSLFAGGLLVTCCVHCTECFENNLIFDVASCLSLYSLFAYLAIPFCPNVWGKEFETHSTKTGLEVIVACF